MAKRVNRMNEDKIEGAAIVTAVLGIVAIVLLVVAGFVGWGIIPLVAVFGADLPFWPTYLVCLFVLWIASRMRKGADSIV